MRPFTFAERWSAPEHRGLRRGRDVGDHALITELWPAPVEKHLGADHHWAAASLVANETPEDSIMKSPPSSTLPESPSTTRRPLVPVTLIVPLLHRMNGPGYFIQTRRVFFFAAGCVGRCEPYSDSGRTIVLGIRLAGYCVYTEAEICRCRSTTHYRSVESRFFFRIKAAECGRIDLSI